MIDLLTGHFVRTSEQVSIVARWAGGAFRQDLGDSLTINGAETLTPDNAGKSASVVGLFLYDANSNGVSDLGRAFSAPFLVGTDVFMDARTPEFVDLSFNGTKVRISNWPSQDALVSIMFQ